MTLARVSVLAVLLAVAGCAGTPGPGDSGYPFNVEGSYTGSLSADGQAFNGSMQLITEAGGMVSGTFRITQPVQIDGVVEGMLVGDRITMSIQYGNNPVTGCTSGSVSGEITVADNGARLTGPMTIDDCGTVLGGRLDFRR